MNIEALLHIRRVIAEWAETNPIIERARVFHRDWDDNAASNDHLVIVVDVVADSDQSAFTTFAMNEPAWKRDIEARIDIPYEIRRGDPIAETDSEIVAESPFQVFPVLENDIEAIAYLRRLAAERDFVSTHDSITRIFA